MRSFSQNMSIFIDICIKKLILKASCYNFFHNQANLLMCRLWEWAIRTLPGKEGAMLDSIKLCKYILKKIGPANQLKIQKLAYYIQAFHLVYFDAPIINDNFRAWVHGPVSSKIWEYYKGQSLLYNDIPVPGENINIEEDLNTEQVGLVDEVIRVYASFKSYELEALTHSEQPWKEARGNLSHTDKCNTIIKQKSMKDFYRTLVDSNN
ncbi:MAG: Panacea domain-containing protein [Mobilitalea sp.]